MNRQRREPVNGTPTTTVATRKDKGGLTDHIDLKTAFTIISAKRLSLYLVIHVVQNLQVALGEDKTRAHIM